MSLPLKNKKSAKKQSNLTAAVNAAVLHLSKAQAALPIDDNLIERDRKAAVALVKFPTEALQTAMEILETEKERTASFDHAKVSHALAYDMAMKKVLRQTEALVSSIQRTLWKNRAPGIEQTLALYAWLKRGSRHDGSLVKYVAALAPHVILQKRAATRAAKAANGASATAPAASVVVTPTATGTAKPAVTNGASPNGAPAATAVTNGASAPPIAHA